MPKKLQTALWVSAVIVALTSIPVLVVMAQDTTPAGTAYVMVGNFSPDSPAVDIYINGTLIGDNLSFSQATFPVGVTAGDIFISVHDASKPVTDPPIVDGYKSVTENNYYMVPVMNVLDKVQFGAYRIPVYEALGPTETRAQFFHAVPDGPRLDVINATTKETVVEAMGYVEEPVVVGNLPAGAYTWQVWTNYEVIFPGHTTDPNALPDALVIDMGSLDLKARVIYSFWVIGSPTPGGPSVLSLVLAMPFGGGQPVAPPSAPGTTSGGLATITPGPSPTPTKTPTPTATGNPTATRTPEPANVFFSAYDYSAGEGSGITVTVKLSRAMDKAVSVQYATSNGSAKSGSDYTSASGTLSFPIGETSRSFTISTTDDALDEDNETINLTLSSPSGVTLGTPSSGVTATINDNDSMPTVNIDTITVNDVETTDIEEGESAVITLTLSAASGRVITAKIKITGGDAANGFDYAVNPITVTWSAGNKSDKEITISATDDDDPSNETLSFEIELTNAKSGPYVGDTLTILHD